VRLATRTALAAVAAAAVSLLVAGGALQARLGDLLQDRVDDQLRARAHTAPILAAVAERLSVSELSGTVEGARVMADGRLTAVGLLPAGELPPPAGSGWATASADGQRWRLLTVEVLDVPRPGDQALVQLVAPLGDVDTQARELRRRSLAWAVAAAAMAGLVAYGLGRRATRPLTELRRDAGRLDGTDPATWRVADRYGSPEVDEVAATLNQHLRLLAAETEQRSAALEAARAFASSATHELRTPLQGALTNLDIARSDRVEDTERAELLATARRQLQRMAQALAAVRALADAELAAPSWFEPTDLAELVDAAVADEARRNDAEVDVAVVGEPVTVDLWRDGARLAIGNLVRNAVVHGRRTDGRPGRVVVTVEGADVVVTDDGPGIAPCDRERLVRRFERGSGGGSGLGLAIAHQVALAHGGALELGAAPAGGARVRLRLAPPPPPGPARA
jgi:two-component system sensor histidine kinase PrrB